MDAVDPRSIIFDDTGMPGVTIEVNFTLEQARKFAEGAAKVGCTGCARLWLKDEAPDVCPCGVTLRPFWWE